MPRQYNAPPDEDANNNIYYGRIPQRVPRHKTLKLFHGNFVLGSAVPMKLLNLYAYKDDDLTHMRYSAATGDPNDLKDNGFTLRPVHYDPPRRAEFFIVMTMYNEDDTLFVRTMHGVMKNIAYLCKGDRIAVTESNKIEGAEKGIVPVQIVFCLKEKKSIRIASSSMPLALFSSQTSAHSTSIGGACGEIVAFKGKYGQTLLNPLVAAQNFEYKMSNILDKPSDSGACPLCAPSARSQDSITLNAPGQYSVPLDDDANIDTRYGRISQRVPHHNKTLKRIEILFHDNVVLDSAVPTKLLNLCTYKDERKFKHVHYDPPHRMVFFIVMTTRSTPSLRA
ncbi:chitin synthase N-terminal-domain-containing protein [Lactarius sanguifluus]|nr:chitin synthase N-terminal-domain-containing protein [Lactarius sanguifluus]